MAKRRRLTPARGVELGPEDATRFARETPGSEEGTGPEETKSALPPARAPIATLAGDAAQRAALDEVTDRLARARAEGHLAEALPLEAVVDDHLIRDRAVVGDEEMEALVASLKARGQQVPIEVSALGDGRYGLISGWRRLQALRAMAEAGEGPGTVLAVTRPPGRRAADAYLAMVEENEIRADLSFWERGRIVARTLEAGVFETQREALNGLFGSVPRARRSKIGSFVLLVWHLDGVLRHPARLSERLGLALAGQLKAVETKAGRTALAETLSERLKSVDPTDPAAETAALEAFLSEGEAAPGKETPATARADVEEVAPGIRLASAKRGVTLSGPGVDAAFRERLEAWLASGGASKDG